MGKDTGFKEFERVVPAYQPVEERIRHWQEFALPMAPTEVQEQGAREARDREAHASPQLPVAREVPSQPTEPDDEGDDDSEGDDSEGDDDEDDD